MILEVLEGLPRFLTKKERLNREKIWQCGRIKGIFSFHKPKKGNIIATKKKIRKEEENHFILKLTNKNKE